MYRLRWTKPELYDRIIARFSGVPVDVIEARNFSDEQIQSVVAAYAEIGQIQLSISTQAQTPLQIRSLALRQRQETGLDMVVVDYLQLLRSGRKTNNRAEEVGEISRALKRLAMELKIPVIAMTQMNRQSEMGTGEGGRMPKMSESRESGTIEQDANQFLILHAAGYSNCPGAVAADGRILSGERMDIHAYQRGEEPKRSKGYFADCFRCTTHELLRI